MNIIRLKIMHSFHNKCSHKNIGAEPADNAKPRIELDESKIVTFDNQVRWMLEFIDRGTKEIWIYYFNNDRTKEKILQIVKNNVYSYHGGIINNNDPDENNPATIIYKDYFSIYQELDFNRLGYFLYRVNHSIWLGQGLFYTNSIEGVWNNLKRLTDYITGLNGKIFYLNLLKHHHKYTCL